jgi:uncharacterized protein
LSAGEDLPWYISLSGSIIIILVGIYKKLNIGLTMLLGALTLGVLAGLPFSEFFKVIADGLINKITVMLVISILLLGILGNVLKETGALDTAVDNLKDLLADIRIISAAMPALIGMLTVPGGAILSAPLCAATGEKLALPAHRQAAVNVWFRHVLYFMLPIFPSLIIASNLSGVPMSRFVLLNLPVTLIGILCGFLFLFRGYPSPTGNARFSGIYLWGLLRSILPLFLVMFMVVFFDLYFPFAIAAGILLALINYLPASNAPAIFLKRLQTQIIPGIKLPVALVIVGIMIYKEMLEKSAVLSEMTGIIISLGIPVLGLIMIIPFVIGVLTGDNSASVAIIYPMFLPLLQTYSMPAYSAYIVLIYTSSTAGHIISPAHPCFALTKEYFKTTINNLLILILPLLAIVMAAGLLVTFIFSR